MTSGSVTEAAWLGDVGRNGIHVNVVKEEVGAVCVVKRLQMRMKGV